LRWTSEKGNRPQELLRWISEKGNKPQELLRWISEKGNKPQELLRWTSEKEMRPKSSFLHHPLTIKKPHLSVGLFFIIPVTEQVYSI
jgi:hypothetical protein